jgi:hypothetical protein
MQFHLTLNVKIVHDSGLAIFQLVALMSVHRVTQSCMRGQLALLTTVMRVQIEGGIVFLRISVRNQVWMQSRPS